jgi:hypothetical protein
VSLTQTDFGPWASTLSPDEFACALAELGLGDDGTWRLSDRTPLDIDVARARALAAAWLAGRGAQPRRIRIDGAVPHLPGDPFSNDLWLAERLVSAVPASRSSIYVRQDDQPAAVEWRWPVTVGFPADPASRAIGDLLAAVATDRSLGSLVRFVVPPGERVDLLIVAGDLRQALAAAREATPGPRASCAILLDEDQTLTSTSARDLKAWREVVRSSGIAHGPRPRDPLRWFVDILDALSHGLAIDTSLFYAARKNGVQPPLVVASDALVGSVLPEISARGKSATRSRGRGQRSAPPARPREEIEEAARAEPVAAVPEARSTGEAPSSDDPRFIQAQIQRLPGGEPTPVFVANAQHAVDVRIGPAEAGWLGPPADHAFPDRELPTDRDEYELRLVLVEPTLLPQPQEGVVRLPKRGPSSVHRFLLDVPAGAERVDARLIVSYENRVLQTAVMAGAVGAPIELTIEAVVRPTPAGLDQRRSFDAALVVNQDRRGATLTKLASGHVAFTTVPDLQKEIDWFDRQLTDVARNRRDYAGGLESEPVANLLRTFALHGSLLYQYLVTDTLGEEGIAHGNRLQIVSTSPEARLPVEFVYDRKPPDANAELCKHHLAALASGKCDDACPRGADQRTVVCPLGFWGFSKVIERHAHDPRTARALGASSFAFQAEPVGVRQAISVLQGAQIAASHRVSDTVPDGLERLRLAADPVLQTPALAVSSWDDWAAGLGQPGRSLLVLLVHTATAGEADPMPQMEIGDGSWLVSARLDERYVRPTLANPAPVVLLLGCETAAPEVSFAGLASQFRRHGAAIVVSTGSKIHSDQAVPIAAGLINELGRIEERNEGSFGEVMLGMRRRLLADGHVMVLTLTAFGDADWRLAP